MFCFWCWNQTHPRRLENRIVLSLILWWRLTVRHLFERFCPQKQCYSYSLPHLWCCHSIWDVEAYMVNWIPETSRPPHPCRVYTSHRVSSVCTFAIWNMGHKPSDVSSRKMLCDFRGNCFGALCQIQRLTLSSMLLWRKLRYRTLMAVGWRKH